MKLLSVLLAGGALLPLTAAYASDATSFPEKPITVVVPFTAGAGPDVLTRELARIVSEETGQPVIVNNRPGASSSIAAQAVAKAPADGYTVLLTGNVAMTGNRHTFKQLSYDPVTDFAPITTVARGPMILYVSTENIGATSIGELADFARSRPQPLRFAYTSITGRLPAEMLKLRTGIQLEGVAYKSGAQALPDLVAGRIDLSFTDLSAWTYVEQGKLRPLAVTDSKRSSYVPDLPTMQEAGLKDVSVPFWLGVYAPAGTPAPIVDRLNRLFGEASKSATAQHVHKFMGTEPFHTTPKELAVFQEKEAEQWGQAIREAGIELQ